MYKLVRFYQNGNKEIIVNGLSLEDAQEHCEDPETSSTTCTDHSHAEKHWAWFDVYTEE